MTHKFQDLTVFAGNLGRCIGEFHAAVVSAPRIKSFAPESFTIGDFQAVLLRLAKLMEEVQETISEAADSSDMLAEVAKNLEDISILVGEALNSLENELSSAFLSRKLHKIRCHGDLHLGHLLLAKDELFLVDFEGSSVVSGKERGRKELPDKDIATLLYSLVEMSFLFVESLLSEEQEGDESIVLDLHQVISKWLREMSGAFLESYQKAVAGSTSIELDKKTHHCLLQVFLLEINLRKLLESQTNEDQRKEKAALAALNFVLKEFILCYRPI